MHLYFIARGIKDKLDAMINDLQAQYFPYPTAQGKKAVQLSVRPVQLYEVVFPKDSLPEVLRMFNYQPKEKYYKKFTKYFALFRRLLGCKKIPKTITKEKLKNTPQRPIRKDWVAVHFIGIKPDKIKNGAESL